MKTSKVVVVQVIYNNKPWIEPVFSAIFNQTYKNFEVVVVIAGNDDSSKELLEFKFPNVKIIDPSYNIGFAKGHNLVFDKYRDADFFQLINPDLIIEPNYIEEMLKAFKDDQVGAATGKLYQIPNSKQRTANIKKILDTTGVSISKSGRARDRGQHEIDTGQYDASRTIDVVSGAGAMYRRQALESVQLPKFDLSAPLGHLSASGEENIVSAFEYFDEDFHSYWEDVDLSWRMKNKGYKNVFMPMAVGYHARTAGSSRKGYLHIIDFIRHHRSQPAQIRQLNYKNHIFMYIKNSPYFYPQFFIREFFMLIYILFFEISTLKIMPELVKQLPKIWKKRKLTCQS